MRELVFNTVGCRSRFRGLESLRLLMLLVQKPPQPPACNWKYGGDH
ncbi:MAG TPA: hypothetical protein VIS52_02275 [Motiliproteus sp.]